MHARITIDDINIRAAVLRRMFEGMREPPANERREIMARYVASDATDSVIMRNHSHSFPLHRDTQGYRNTYTLIHAQG